MLGSIVSQKCADVSEMLPAYISRAISLILEAVITSETSVDFYETR
jgi:hypothetical protein